MQNLCSPSWLPWKITQENDAFSNVASWKVVRFQVFQKLIIFYCFQLDCQCLNILANTEEMVPQLILKNTTPGKLTSWAIQKWLESKHFLQIVGENEGWKSHFLGISGLYMSRILFVLGLALIAPFNVPYHIFFFFFFPRVSPKFFGH